jgi:glycosyltransferase involved in cell wall biosynthesis
MNSNKQVLIILTPGFPQDESDSTCLPAQQNFIKAINKNYPEIKVIILSFQYPFTNSVYKWNGNLVYAFGGKNRNGLYRRLLWSNISKQLKKLLTQNEIKGLLSFWCDECALVASRFSKKYTIPHYCWLLGQDAKAGNRYVSAISNTENGFIALSDFIAAEFKKNYSIQPAVTIPLGINPCDFKTDEVERDIDILAAGSLIALKQFPVFLQVTAHLKNSFPNLKAVLCGSGPELAQLKAYAMQLGIAANISFTGELPHSELLQLMRRSKVFLHPSLYEGLGMVCPEALYAGAQVISFCRPMHGEINNWHIVNDVTEMRATTKQLLLHRPEPETVLFYTAEKTAKEIIRLYGFDR